MLERKDKIKSILLGTLTAFAIFYIIDAVFKILDMPDVHVSNSTGECVSVINYKETDTYSCDRLPSRYHQVWIR